MWAVADIDKLVMKDNCQSTANAYNYDAQIKLIKQVSKELLHSYFYSHIALLNARHIITEENTAMK